MGRKNFILREDFTIIYVKCCKPEETDGKFFGLGQRKMEAADENMAFTAGIALTEISKSHCGNETVSQAKTLHYIDRLIDYFLDLRDADVDEMTKDVWQLEKLDIQVKQDLTRTTRIINFKEISQQDLREEVKKAIYFQLKTESIGTVKKEMTAIRRFSRYLEENNKESRIPAQSWTGKSWKSI